jgi:hypothetical protein
MLHSIFDFEEITNCKKGTPMPKHMAKHRKKVAKHARTARHLKRAHVKKSTQVKKAVSRQDHIFGKAAGKQQGLEPDAVELEFVDLEALSQEPESVADVVEIFQVEVVSDDEVNGQSDEPELTLGDSD